MRPLAFFASFGLLLLMAVVPSRAQSLNEPALTVTTSEDGRFQLHWAGTNAAFTLEQTENLRVGGVWLPVGVEPTAGKDGFSVSLFGGTVTRFFRLHRTLTRIAATSPVNGETGVAVTRETIVHFSAPLSSKTTLSTNSFYAGFGGRRLLSRVSLSLDRTKATLFFLEPMPGSTRVTVVFDGTNLVDEQGSPLDPDGDSVPGGQAVISFDTLNLTPLSGTAVIGTVYASELLPGSGAGADTANIPLPGVTITVDGQEQTLRAVTDAQGNFKLDPAPPGRFFVHIDGRTATNPAAGIHYPDQAYYPFVGKAWEALAGRTNNLAGGTGKIYLPLIVPGTLQAVSSTSDTTITFPASTLVQNPALAGVRINVSANSLFADDGTRGGKVGIAPVPPDRLPGPLPPGLEMPIVITVQTDGALNFDKPAPICFPNVPDKFGNRLPAGSATALMSFDHKKGDWEAVGTATVSPDGALICSDAGSGILKPGWHGIQSPNPKNDPGPPPPPPLPPPPPPPSPPCLADPAPKAGTIRASADDRGLSADADPCLPPCGNCGLPQAVCDCQSRCRAIREEARNLCKARFAFNLAICQQMPNELAAQCRANASTFEESKACDRKLYQDLLSCRMQFEYDLRACLEEADREAESCGFLCLDMSPACEGVSERDAPLNSREGVQAAQAETKDFFGDAKLALVSSFFDSMIQLAEPFIRAGEPVPDTVFDSVAELLAQAQREAGGDLVQYLRDATIRHEATAVAKFAQYGEFHGDQPPYPIHIAYEIIETERTIICPADQIETRTNVVRTMTDSFAQYNIYLRSSQNQNPRPVPCNDGRVIGTEVSSRLGRILFFDQRTKRYGEAFQRRVPGLASGISGFTLIPYGPEDLDSDHDGLPDIIEYILGTDPNRPDSDGDGIPDGAEVGQDTDPLDGRPALTGIIATVNTPGTAVDVSALNDLVAVAEQAAGVSLFQVNGVEAPTLVAQVATPGSAKAVSLSGDFLAVAADSGGLVIIDISDPAHAQVVQKVRISGSVQAVTAASSMGYAGGSAGHVYSVDLTTGTILDQVDAGDSIQDLAIDGDTLFVLTSGELRSYKIDDFSLLGKVPTSNLIPEGISHRKRLFVGGGFAYTTCYPGYDSFDVHNPASLQRLGFAREGGPNSFKQIVANGSGLGVAAVGVNPRNDGTHDINLYDLKNPAITSQYLATLVTPGIAYALSIYNGLAYVADGDAGLQVINYLTYDAQGIPPTITLTASFPLAPPQAEEGKSVYVTANVSDDVQVRNVEFYLDGQEVTTDGNFPFQHRFVAPLRNDTRASFRLQARATDTGGNSTFSPEIIVQLTADSTPPVGKPKFPEPASIAGSVDNVSVRFNEPIQPNTLNAQTFRLTFAGPDGIFGTADDLAVANGTIVYQETGNTGLLVFYRALPAGLYRALISAGVADLTGNKMTNEVHWTFRVIAGVDSDHDGLPDDLETELGLDPFNSDSNGNGIPDGLEDLDRDGLSNVGEVIMGTDPRNPHSADLNILDGDLDRDNDGLTDAQELRLGTNPFLADTDGDNWNDEAEVSSGSDPLDPDSTPELTSVASPPLAVILTGESDGTSLGTGATMAQPGVAIIVPGDQQIEGTSNVWVAQPTLSIILNSAVETDGAAGMFMAQPLLTLVLPDDADGATSSAVVASPPLGLLVPVDPDVNGTPSALLAEPPVTIKINPP